MKMPLAYVPFCIKAQGKARIEGKSTDNVLPVSSFFCGTIVPKRWESPEGTFGGKTCDGPGYQSDWLQREMGRTGRSLDARRSL
jgi:hypothetical protein